MIRKAVWVVGGLLMDFDHLYVGSVCGWRIASGCLVNSSSPLMSTMTIFTIKTSITIIFTIITIMTTITMITHSPKRLKGNVVDSGYP